MFKKPITNLDSEFHFYKRDFNFHSIKLESLVGLLREDGENHISLEDLYTKFPELEKSDELSSVLSSLPEF